MATRRRSARRVTGGGRHSPPPFPSHMLVAVIVGITAVVVVLGLFVMTIGGETEARPVLKPAEPARTRTPEPRRGSTPGRPAPEIPDTAFAAADALYEEAREQWTNAQQARQAGETAVYGRRLRDAWSKLEELGQLMEPYTDWFELADLEGWAMPASYGRLQDRLNRWDPLRRKVQKLKPVGR